MKQFIRGHLPKTVIVSPISNIKYIVDGVNWIEIPNEFLKQEIDEYYIKVTKPNLNFKKDIQVSILPFRQWEVQSSSDLKVKYIVKLWKFGNWSCTCLGFSFRRNCKHIEACKNKLKG